MIKEITIFMFIYFILDGLHDSLFFGARPVIANKVKERLWHYLDSFIKVGVATYVSYLLKFSHNFWELLVFWMFVASFRALVFNFALNLFRKGISMWHLGSKGFESDFVTFIAKIVKDKKILTKLGCTAEVFGNRSYWAFNFCVMAVTQTILIILNT